jgi:hypothetical protein
VRLVHGTAGQYLKSGGDAANPSWDTPAGGAALTVEESDGTPTVANTVKIKVTNGTLTDNGSGVVTLDFGAAATDAAAIHDDVSGEIHAIASKTTPVAADELVIEDSVDTWAKKRIAISSLPTGGGNAVYVEDDFTRADSATVGAACVVGGPPAMLSLNGAAGDWGITSNSLAPKSARGENNVFWNAGTTRLKYTITLGSSVGTDAGATFRVSASAGWISYLMCYFYAGTGHYQLYKYIGASYTLLQDSAVHAAPGDVVVITDTGTKISVTVNGTALWTDLTIGECLGGVGVGLRESSATSLRIAGIKVEAI